MKRNGSEVKLRDLKELKDEIVSSGGKRSLIVLENTLL